MDHRVVTLGPAIHAGLLAEEKHRPELEEHGFPWIDLVYCNLYPLQDEIAKDDSTLESIIGQTDIGGPTMLRSAAKGRRLVIVYPADCDRVLQHLRKGTEKDKELISYLVAKAEATVANYCLASARYHSDGGYEGFIGERVEKLGYGENRQDGGAAFYALLEADDDPLALTHFKRVEGAAPGFINFTDFDRVLKTMTRLSATCDANDLSLNIAVGVKHGNPCGTAIGKNSLGVIKAMIDGDSEAIFGGIIATNFAITEAEAELLRNWSMGEGSKRILDGILAPFITPEAINILKRKNGACKMYTNPALEAEALENLSTTAMQSGKTFRPVRGGFLVQNHPTFVLDMEDERLKKIGTLTEGQKGAMLVAQCVAWTSNSNNISLAQYCAETETAYLIANGNNQTKRIAALDLAISKAKKMGHSVAGSVMASDSFCPFEDVPLRAGEEKIAAGFIPEKGIRAEQVFAEFEKQGISIVSGHDDICRGFGFH
ncbi:hypothetical protein ACFL1U_03370 [Patescibacteria group bacterium]